MKTAHDYISQNSYSVYEYLTDTSEIIHHLSRGQYNKFFNWIWPEVGNEDSYDCNDGPFIIQRTLDLPIVKQNPKSSPIGWYIFYLLTSNRPIVIIQNDPDKTFLRVRVDWSTTNREGSAIVNRQLLRTFGLYFTDKQGEWVIEDDVITSPSLYHSEVSDSKSARSENVDRAVLALMSIVGLCGNYGVPVSVCDMPVYDMWQEVEKYLSGRNKIIIDQGNPNKGYVYLIEAYLPGNLKSYKIGRSRDMSNRLKMFNVKLPFEFDIIHTIETEDTRQLERILHRKFAHKRTNGEWFDLTDEDIAWIKGYKVED